MKMEKYTLTITIKIRVKQSEEWISIAKKELQYQL